MPAAEARAGARADVAPPIENGRALAATASLVLCGISFAVLSPSHALVASVTAAALVFLSVFDLERARIPDEVVLPALAIVLLAQIALFPQDALEWLLAPAITGLVLALPAFAGRSWVGMGDVKVVLLLGAALGWHVIGAVFFACLGAIPFTLALVVREGSPALKRRIPFAPFLAFGGLLVLLAPQLASIATA